MNLVKKINLKKSPFPELLIFSIALIVFLYIIQPYNIAGADCFYHAKIAKLIEKQGLIKNFPWTQFTTYKNLFVDHHFGYHLILSLFLKIPSPKTLDSASLELEPIFKTELATAFLAAFFFLAFFIVSKKIKIRLPFFWTLLLLTISGFIGRLSLIRAPALSLIIMTLATFAVIKKKHFLLLATSFIYVWFYGAWPLLFIIIFIYFIAKALFKKSLKDLFALSNFKLLLSVVLGLGLGLVINPYFPKTFPFYFFQTIQIAILGTSKVAIGNEWYSPDFLQFLIYNLPVLLLWFVSITWFFIKKNKQKTLQWFLLLTSGFFFLYTLKSIRNIDYFIPFAIIFSGLMFNQIIKGFNWQKIKMDISKLFQTNQKQVYAISTILMSCILIFFIGFSINSGIISSKKNHQESQPLNHLQAPLNWLEKNSQKGDIVYHQSWDMFPRLFYFNHKNYYINGLDQNFFYAYDKEKYKVWEKIIKRKINPLNLNSVLKKEFKAKYVLSDKNNEKFHNLLEKSNLEKIYNSPQASIYKTK